MVPITITYSIRSIALQPVMKNVSSLTLWVVIKLINTVAQKTVPMFACFSLNTVVSDNS